MQQAIQVHTLVDQAVVNAIPHLKPLLGHRIQMIALDLGQPDTEQAEKKITFEEFLASRPAWPKDRPLVTLEEMEAAILQGALDSASIDRAHVYVTVLPASEMLPRPALEASPVKHSTLREMNAEERAAYLAEMRGYWRDRLSSSEAFARAKAEEIALENRRWPENP